MKHLRPNGVIDMWQRQATAAAVASARKMVGDGVPVRAFVCTSPNPWGYPAKDRSGRLKQLEKPHLGELIAKLTAGRKE